MATNYAGTYVSSSTTVHTGEGVLLGLIISNTQAAVDTITVYDNTAASGTVLLKLYVPSNAAEGPQHITWPRSMPIAFSTGLHVAPSKSVVNVWAIGK
jgi:hypothetical protein